MTRFSFIFTALALGATITSGFASPLKRSIPQLETDIAGISAAVNTFSNSAVVSTPPTAGQITDLGTSLLGLGAAFGTAAIEAGITPPFSSSDATTVVSAIGGFTSVLNSALGVLASEGSQFGPLDKTLLTTYLTDVSLAEKGFFTAILTKIPTSDTTDSTTATGFKNAIDGALNGALGALENLVVLYAR